MLQGESIDAIRQELLDGRFSKDDVEYIGHINMGTLDWYIASHPTTLPKNGDQFETFSTFTHELFHALGVLSLTYDEGDGFLADDMDELVDDIEDVVGFESLNHFGEYEEDAVHVRNDRLKADYEILVDTGNYNEVHSKED